MTRLHAGILFLVSLHLSACGGQLVAWPDGDDTAPTVTSTRPADNATDVALDSTLRATFDEAMDPLTLSAETFTLENGNAPIDGTVTRSETTVTFEPDDSLEPDTEYTATIANEVTDLAGNAMAADYVWTFRTEDDPEPSSAPRVVSTSPDDEAVDVAVDTNVSATFSEAMDPLTLSAETFTLEDGTLAIEGSVTRTGTTVTFEPDDSLEPDTEYTATITTDATDLSGDALAADYRWTFTTGPVLENVRPRVTFTVPADNATGAPIGGNVAAVFSEAMDPSTITTASFTVEQLNTQVAGTVTYTNVTATFNPTSPLALNTVYSATITTAVTDLAGNSLLETYVWSFRTGATLDTTRPSVVSTIPEHEDTDVFLDTNVSATFSEVMDPLSLTTTTFTLEDGAAPLDGTVTQVGALALFNPTDNLEPDTEYTATISTQATDLAGNPLAEDYVWTFTTGSDLDTEAPTVVATNPDDEDTEVPLDATVNATFSEALDPLTITTVTFEVTGPGTSEVTGTLLYDATSLIATFTPDGDLLPATAYTATIGTGVTDLAGNALEEDYVFTFSTGETPSDFVPVDLGTLSTFVAVAGAGLTNSNSSGTTTLNGDVGLSPTGTCLGDGSPCTAINPVINGTLYANDPEGVAAQAKADLTAAYADAASRPVGTTVNDITGMVLAPGVYSSDSTMSIAVGGSVTLDGQGDANAVWIFQIGSSLTVNNDAQVVLVNGARARNVFWAVFASSTLGSNVAFQGSILAGSSNSVGTDSVVVGRLLCTTGAISLLSNTITLPPL